MENKEKTEKFDINALAIEYGKHFNIKRDKKESDYDYRSKVAGELRKQGHLVEAHEAFSGRRYDDPDQGTLGPMTGILGAAAKAAQGIEFSPNDYERQIGDDLGAGIIVKNGNRNKGLENMFKIFGPEGTIDILNAFRK
jgi:hypothetical protein